MRGAEAKLDTFWDQVDKHMMKCARVTLLKFLGRRITPREVYRTQPWQIPNASAQQKQKKDEKPLEIYDFPSTPTTTTSETLSTEPKVKAKTRGQADTSRESASTDIPEGMEEVEKPRQIFKLPSRPFKTMSTFFPASNEERAGGKVVWKDFLHAMYKLDFKIEKRHGSEWYFEPVWQRDAPITIHEPHPSNEIRFGKMRFEANRLARKYGWTKDTFQAI